MAGEINIEEAVRRILCEVLSKKPEQITPDANLSKDLDVRSMEFLDIYEELDKEFDIDMDDDANEIQTVADLVKYIEGRVGEAA
ncbi:MAG: acyl carrier protein [Nitrospiraceae bacterium]|nr:acyl carrier protein [Nitrospiraceae bacterium]